MSAIWGFLFGWLPTVSMRLAFAGLMVIAIIFIVLRIIKIVLDAIPFI